ncbi:MspA family porin, partial [Gordonia soli]
AAVAVVGLASMGAGGAAAAKLPNGYKKAVSIDGLVAQTWRTGESALPAPSVAANGAGRSAVASGTWTSKLSKGTGNIEVGYLVGCQIDITGFEGSFTGALDFIAGSADGSASVSIPLKPGQVAYAKLTDKDIKKGIASIQSERFEIDVQQCGGYASARSVAKVVAAEGFNTDDGTVNGEGGYVQSTLYGKPFSLN